MLKGRANHTHTTSPPPPNATVLGGPSSSEGEESREGHDWGVEDQEEMVRDGKVFMEEKRQGILMRKCLCILLFGHATYKTCLLWHNRQH